MAAPALAASTQELAICSGVTGTAGFLPGESAEPVTAQEIITLRCMDVILPDDYFRHGTPAQGAAQPGVRPVITGQVPPGLPRFVHCAKPAQIPFLERIRT